MDFELDTLHGSKFSGKVNAVELLTAAGQATILPHHEPYTAVILPGPVVIHPSGGHTETFAIFGGVFEIHDNRARLLADEADHEWDLIADEIEAAIAKAEQIKASATAKAELHRAHEMLDRSAVRLEVAKLRRRRRGI